MTLAILSLTRRTLRGRNAGKKDRSSMNGNSNGRYKCRLKGLEPRNALFMLDILWLLTAENGSHGYDLVMSWRNFAPNDSWVKTVSPKHARATHLSMCFPIKKKLLFACDTMRKSKQCVKKKCSLLSRVLNFIIKSLPRIQFQCLTRLPPKNKIC